PDDRGSLETARGEVARARALDGAPFRLVPGESSVLEDVGRRDRALEGGRPDLLERGDVLVDEGAAARYPNGEASAADRSDGAEGNLFRRRGFPDRPFVSRGERDHDTTRGLAEQKCRRADRLLERDFGARRPLHGALGERDRETSVRDVVRGRQQTF